MTEIECGTIYKVTSPSGKVYIGQTTRPVEQRWNDYKIPSRCEEQTKLHRSLQKYGYENHTFEVVITSIHSEEMLNWYEIFYIALYDSYENGLNCTLGGEGALKLEEELKYGLRRGNEMYDKTYYLTNKEKRKNQYRVINQREKAIRTYFGYKHLEWIALSKEERALLRSQFRK